MPRVTLSSTAVATLKAMHKQFQNGDGTEPTVPLHITPRRDGESYDAFMARLKTEPKVTTLAKFRIRIPNTGSRASWRTTTTPSEPTMKSLKKFGLVEEISYNQFRLTEKGRMVATGNGSKVDYTVPRQPKRIEYTMTPQQAVETARVARVHRIESHKRAILEELYRMADRLTDCSKALRRKAEALEEAPELWDRERLYYTPQSGEVVREIHQTLNQMRPDVFIRHEVELARLMAEAKLVEEDSGPNVEAVRWETPTEEGE